MASKGLQVAVESSPGTKMAHCKYPSAVELWGPVLSKQSPNELFKPREINPMFEMLKITV